MVSLLVGVVWVWAELLGGKIGLYAGSLLLVVVRGWILLGVKVLVGKGLMANSLGAGYLARMKVGTSKGVLV